MNVKSTIFNYYQKNEKKVDISFFLGGFIFDVFTLAEVNDLFSITQQIFYLLITGYILYADYLYQKNYIPPSKFLQTLWNFKKPVFHFCLGSLISIYSLYFLISASFFTSLFFVLFLLTLLVINEIKFIQESKVNIKLSLYIIVLFCFYSMMWPILLGFVGYTPFILSILTCLITIYTVYKMLCKKINDNFFLKKSFLLPSFSVITLFLLFYLLGWIPPVPLSVKKMGIYHQVEKKDNQYYLQHQNPWWKFWKNGDQEFIAYPGDRIFFFARISSPAGFDDEIILHWYQYFKKRGWLTTDKVKMNVRGGRTQGYRGFSVKQNYSEGNWRVSVETTDGREIGRLYFTVINAITIPFETTSNREFYTEQE